MDLSYNKITEIAGVSALESLTHLNLSHNTIKTIKNLDHLTLLTDVNLAHNAIESLDGLKVRQWHKGRARIHGRVVGSCYISF